MSEFRIIDSHCHIYPDAIARKAVEAVDRFYDGLPGEAWDGTVQTLLNSGRAAGISRFVVHSVATRPEQVSSINHFIARSVASSEGAFIGMGTMQLDSDDLERDLDELVSLGLRGGKLHPDIQRFRVDEPRAMRMFSMCEDRNLPVCVHTGDFRYDYSNPARVANVLRAFPKLRFIGAHFGGWSVWDEAALLLPEFPNLIVDSSSTFYTVPPDKGKALIRAYGADRVLFGTDYPLWHQQPDIEYLLRLELTNEEYEAIFWRNAARLFALEFDEQEDVQS